MSAAEAPPVLAIRNARVIRVSGPTLPRATVIVRNGLIESVGENTAVPADAWVIEGEGLNIYPGLIDAVSTAGLAPPAGPAPAAAAAPAVIRGPQDRPSTQSWTRAADLIRPGEAAIATARARGFTSAAVFPAQGLVGGQGALINLGGGEAGKMIVAAPLAQSVSLTPQRNTSFRSFPSSVMGVYAYLRQLYADLDYYLKQKRDYAASPAGRPRPDYDRALEGLAESPRLLLPASTKNDIVHALKLAADIKQPAILHGLAEGYRAADLLRSTPAIVNTRWPRRPEDADPEEPERMRDLEVRDQAPNTPAEFVKAGVKFAFTSGGQSPAEMLRGVRRAMERGLKTEDALRALTLSAAEIFGAGDRLGSVDAGKIANLVVTKGDLLAENPDIQFVLVDGVKYAPVEPAPASNGSRGGRPGGQTANDEEEDPE
jgi:imidazolonepropionase-like amidohydrolase